MSSGRSYGCLRKKLFLATAAHRAASGGWRLFEKRQPVKSNAVLFNETVSPVLNIIGKTSMEAEHELAGFVDRCLRARLHEIQIIHGYGEGILRRMVQEYLSKRPEVESIRLGNFNEGGKGVTFAYLK